MATWKLNIEYEGTRYFGWQEQKNARTVAGEIRAAAAKFLGAPVELIGAGRTDAGVHALDQVARLRSERRAPKAELMRGLNDALPADINILAVKEMPAGFDPRRDALQRHYIYQISTRRMAFAKKFVWWVRDPLDAERMQTAAASLLGKHDFARFAESREDDKSTVVRVDRAELVVEGDLILFRIAAPRFLWKMVRRVVGTLVEVGRGAITPEYFHGLITGEAGSFGSEQFSIAAHTAPPSGLFLERVFYSRMEEAGPLIPALIRA